MPGSNKKGFRSRFTNLNTHVFAGVYHLDQGIKRNYVRSNIDANSPTKSTVMFTIVAYDLITRNVNLVFADRIGRALSRKR